MNDLLATTTEAAQAAGAILAGYFKSDYTIRDKGFHNPVTTADHASNHYLEERLRDTFPDYGWLSEETVDTQHRLSRERVWVVDPLDGTKEFIEGVGHFVVSVGLVEGGRPIVGVLYNPITDETFAAASGLGATLNGESITVSTLAQLDQAEVLNSRSESRRGLWEPFKPHFRRLKPVGSVAYKLGLAAAGRADLFATLRPKSEWDVCAGHCILNEAGAELRVLTGEEVHYNNQQVVIKPGLVGGNPAIVRAFMDLYQSNHEIQNEK